MDYSYTEAYALRVSVKMTLQQIEEMRTLAVKLLGDSEEAQAARTLVGLDSWDLRKLRDQAGAALVLCADAMRYEADRLASTVKADE